MNRTRKSEIPEVVTQLGIRIKDVIEENKLKQREVAHDAEMDVENLRKYIKGKQEMKISTLFKIAQSLKISPSDLIKDL
ncbi:helix-turn-helix transcriptional regulator [Flavobacterium psychroterrae]|jgi:transcriptional regulator with XRE-family HTH domain|uniref:Helix-turn-helix transcriptional regulator n=1 Tax=Flavobacterium psychroterrae TaxID=2133767 RepID=A0ABS5P927_9FLAO|nr:helix-turn-helix transcriptional regulator [Flavobacterium psychroterrae]MBS7230773.1 helix-turn-helix transcriptional regulator [Flavobacterium psychroterrae]